MSKAVKTDVFSFEGICKEIDKFKNKVQDSDSNEQAIQLK